MSIAKPMLLLLRQSLEESSIVEGHKMSLSPIHKGGSELMPTSYRPVSLTSHVINILKERGKRHIKPD